MLLNPQNFLAPSARFPLSRGGRARVGPPAPQALPRYVDNEDAGINGSHGYKLNHLSTMSKRAQREIIKTR